MQCPRCESANYFKNGNAHGKPRKKCKVCGCNFTQSQPRGKPKELKEEAVELYLEGLGFRSIGRHLKVSDVSVMNWVRIYGERAKECRASVPSGDVVEVDEMYTYIGNKKSSLDLGRHRQKWEEIYRFLHW